MIQAVFLDIDNTLTSPATRQIPQSARQAIAAARARGIKVFAATGRNTCTQEEGAVLQGLELDGYVAVNGQLCYLPDGTLVHRLALETGDVERVRAFCDQGHIPLVVSEERHNYITHIDGRVRAFHEKLQIPLYDVRPADDLAGRVILALCPFIDAAQEAALYPRLQHSAIVRFDPNNCDIIPLGGGKDVGIGKMLAHFAIPRENALAMGDGGNDIAMLRYAGVGVAMAGSSPDVLAAADWVAPGPDEDGILHTFHRYGVL